MNDRIGNSIVFGSGSSAPTFTAFGDMRVSTITPLAGWSFSNGINPGIVTTTTTGSGSVTTSQAHAVVATGTTAGSTASIRTIKTNRYIPGIGGVFRCTCLFPTIATDGHAVIGLLNSSNGWAFGYNAGQYGVLRRRDGVDNWTYVSDWNGRSFPMFSPGNGIPFELAFQWLGYGAQRFSASLPNGQIIPIHTIEYSNTETEVSVLNPNLPITAEVSNGSTAENIEVRSPSAMSGLEGDAFSVANSIVLATDVTEKSINAGVETPVISLFQAATFNSQDFQGFVQALRLTVAADGTKNVTFRAYAGNSNPVTGGSFVAINSLTSPVTANKTATTFSATGQQLIGTYPTAKTGSENISLAESNFFGYPGQYITITAISTNASSVSAGVGFRQFL